jgi:hypothetical protein
MLFEILKSEGNTGTKMPYGKSTLMIEAAEFSD